LKSSLQGIGQRRPVSRQFKDEREGSQGCIVRETAFDEYKSSSSRSVHLADRDVALSLLRAIGGRNAAVAIT